MLRQRFIMSLGVILIGLFLFQTVTTYVYTHYIMPDPVKPVSDKNHSEGVPVYKNDGIIMSQRITRKKLDNIERIPRSKEVWTSLKADVSDSPLSYLQYIILITLFSLMVWKLTQSHRVKKRRNLTEEVTDDVPIAQSIFRPASLKKSPYHLYTSYSSSRVRDLVIHFEKRLPRGQQRRPNETLEDWLRRIKIPVDFQLYRNIRYGDMSETIVTDDEILRFEQQLARYSSL
ncbi:hypothetical protein ADM98_07135 [Exiguobacterium sp. BMC-KP]|uniref:hypothetical protein n=1 Tax=Exiguobacterium sp. BMC-KP TaxID=1684312 RepID=UPI0006AA3C6F|nr:hypothetical protein [Exiguobacterium sp. BMC-KP]KOP28704.1 hypothetical protein ADM98_07135 [Exiguobacterium sp. BMC-KP]